MGTSFEIYNLAATLALRRFVDTYRRHMFMLGLFILMVLFSLGFLVRMAMMATAEEGAEDLQQQVTAGGLATVAFVLLFARGLVDVQRSVMRDRALWSTLVAPVDESRVRAGLLLRTVVFQMGLLAVVMGTFALVLLGMPDKPDLPRQTGPLIVLAGIAASTLPLPLLLSAMAWRERSHAVALGAMGGLSAAFLLLLALDRPIEWMLAVGIALLAACLAVTFRGAPSLAPTWSSVEGQRFQASSSRRDLPIPFGALMPRRDPRARALFLREMTLAYPMRQRASLAGLNVAMAVGLVIVNRQMADLMIEGDMEGYYRYLVTPVMVGLGIYALCYFQATMPLVDGVTREGPPFWIMRAVPVTSRDYLRSKVRPLLAFLPLTVVAAGLAIPFVGGMGWRAWMVGMIGASAVYLAFLGVGAWAGATYPNLDRHSNAPPDIVLAFYLMFMCLFLEGFMLVPVAAIAFIDPELGIVASTVVLIAGYGILRLGVHAGSRSLQALEIG
jgi:hypothetical protein